MDDHIFEISENVFLNPSEYIVLCEDSTSFKTLFPDVVNFIGDLNFGLSGGGELIRIFDSTGALADTVYYDDIDPWPEEADGNGPTLELINPFEDNALAINWSASEGDGSAGSINTNGGGESPGDINGDSSVNILDVVMLINFILSGEYNVLADLNGDGGVDVLDIVQLVDIILNQ